MTLHRHLAACGAALLVVFGAAQGAAAQTQALFPSADPDPANAIHGKVLLQALQGGGHVLYFRHTATDFSQTDANMKGMEDCSNQRLLSAQGRRDAERIGKAIATLKIPVGDVQASPYCRTYDTATLMFGKATRNVAVRGAGGNYDSLGELLKQPAPAKTNRAVIGHGNGMRALAGAPHLAEGEAVVMRHIDGKPVIVARIAPDAWAQLAKLGEASR